MPIFEYQCCSCEHSFEALVLSAASETKVSCPECASGQVEKLFSAFSARSKAGDGSTRSLSSGCSGCHATSCAGCK